MGTTKLTLLQDKHMSQQTAIKKKARPNAEACNPHWRLRQEDHKFKATLDNLVRPCLKIKSIKKGQGYSPVRECVSNEKPEANSNDKRQETE